VIAWLKYFFCVMLLLLLCVQNLQGQNDSLQGLLRISDSLIDLNPGGNPGKASESLLSDYSIPGKKFSGKLRPVSHGNISAGYEYGIIPFGPKPSSAMGFYSSQGNASVCLSGLPLTATYYYSSLKSIAGLNNYFRLSFDPARYRDSLQQQAYKKIEEEKKQLSDLLRLQQTLQQQLAYQQILLSKLPSRSYLTDRLLNYQTQRYDSLVPKDSISQIAAFLTDTRDSLKAQTKGVTGIQTYYADSAEAINNLIRQYDKTLSQANHLKEQYESTQKKIHAIRNRLAYLEHPEQVLQQDNPYVSKAQSLLAGIRTLDVGLCYPSHSTFLVNGSTIKGINIEWEKRVYFAFTYGKTINTILTTNNLIQNQLQTAKNLYNFFDFANVQDARKLVAVKVGLGARDATHFHVGFLYGYGLSSYLRPDNASAERNGVIEFDARYLVNGKNSIDLIYGRSALSRETPGADDKASGNSSLLGGVRSNAALIRYISDITLTKTKLMFTGRLVDPFFKSYGIGFIRSDNLRLEGKIEQQLSHRIKLSGFYRRDEDNLLRSRLATSLLQTVGINAFVRVNRRLTARAIYSPVIQRIASADSLNSPQKNINNISTAVVNYTPRLRRATSVFTLLGNYYQLSTGANENYQSYSLTNSTTVGKFRSETSGSYFFNNIGDSLNSTVMLVTNGSLLIGKRAQLTIGLKYANNASVGNQVGGLIRCTVPIMKYLSLELAGERLVTGDFYNYYDVTEISKFPYNLKGRLLATW
jgi:hypothetical protein